MYKPHNIARTLSLLSVGALLPAYVAPALAQQAALEEVIVTAQRREENLQETPIAITALNTETLGELRARDIEGISDYTPGLMVAPTVGGSVNATISIRGALNSTNNLSRDNAVGLYLDGVPIAKTSGAIFDAVDLQRMEVLRGPQGTLYGKNTIGGAINLVTRKPSGELEGYLQVGAGNENLVEARGALDLPAVGQVGSGLGEFSARVSGFFRERDGFYDNTDPSEPDFDNRDQWGGRVDLRLEPSDRLLLEYGYDRFDAQQRPTMLALTQSDTFAYVIPPLYPLVAAATSEDRPDAIANDSAQTSEVDIEGHSLTVTYDMPGTALGDLTLKSITAYRDLHTLSLSDFDGTSLDMFRFRIENDFEQFTQEVQLLGSTDRLEYVLGLFYYEDEWSTDNPRWIFQLGGDNFDVSNRGAKDESVAAFGQLTWTPDAFEQRLDLTVGARWTRETKDVHSVWVDRSVYDVNAADPNGGVYVRDSQGNPVFSAGGDLIPVEVDDSWSEITPMVVAAWRFSEDINGYAKVATGFKSGGFNGVASTNLAFETPFDPETMTTYELGLKSRLFDQRVQFNVSAFYNDYTDFQAGRLGEDAITIVIVNAGDATMQGVEMELTARPTQNLDLVLNYAFLDTAYDNFTGDDGSDVSDDRYFSYSPRNTVFASAKYTFDPLPFGELSARVDYAWKDDFYVNIVDDPSTNVDAYGLLGARVQLDQIPVGDGRLRVAAWGRNLTDEEYWNSAINLSVFTVNQWADPRSYGIEVNYDF
ncbi:TonB-dependent receptor [Parahaliea mediterranea]|uniref:TonB-dependent receptor n=1 Tax=Parahaliea mediterranea TaxID=651086 RepID=A0A939DFC8_9GAMM|nr:TonB-dependent receptor [Parahaliea mediterranea]MBN7797083.1 TonB-dependent receptor [Parahaliea mediterranea]